ncbi:PilZ domain-containing protein [bacterium]|nr:PilZ domain-containing protein [bacterium]
MSVAAPPERRVATRYKPAFGTVCRIGPGRPTHALVWNISETGLSMLLGDPPEPGEVRPAELAHEGAASGLPVWLRVIHVRQVSTGDYQVGAQFDRRLNPDELSQFLLPPAKEERPLPKKG